MQNHFKIMTFRIFKLTKISFMSNVRKSLDPRKDCKFKAIR